MGRLHDLAVVMRNSANATPEAFNTMLQSLWRESNMIDDPQ